jgi:hypothetical protein
LLVVFYVCLIGFCYRYEHSLSNNQIDDASGQA